MALLGTALADGPVGARPLQQVPLLGVGLDEAVQELERTLEVLLSQGFDGPLEGLQGLGRPFVDHRLAHRHGVMLRGPGRGPAPAKP